MKRISVCMATYNGAKFIREQIDSILMQLDDNDELIISDDGSKDDTVSIVSGIQDKRIHLVPSQRFGSVVQNFENALRYADGEIIFLADQDDVWYEGKVEAVRACLETCDLVLTDCRVVDQSGAVLHESFFRSRNSKPGFWRNLWKNAYQGCCMAFNRNVLSYTMPFPKNIDYHDWWIGMMVGLKGTPCFCNQPLIQYRRHGGNISPTGQIPQEKDWMGRLKNRFWLSWYVSGRLLRH